MDKFGLFKLLSSAFTLFGEKKGEMQQSTVSAPQREENEQPQKTSVRASATADIVARQRALEERVRKNKPSE